MPPDRELTQAEREVERGAYLLLLSTHERVYLSARAGGQDARITELDAMIASYAVDARFREAARVYGAYADADFVTHLRSVVGASGSG